MAIVLMILIVLVALILLTGMVTVPQNHVVVLTKFGKYSRVLKEGLQFKLPIIETVYRVNWNKVANKENGRFIELSEQNIDTSPRTCHTKDNVEVEIDASIYWQIENVKHAVFAVDNLPKSLIDSCLNALRAEIGKMSLDQLLSSRRELSSMIARNMQDVTQQWGVSVHRVEIQQLNTSDETAEAMRLEMAAERKRRASILEAEGRAEARKKTAEAEAYAVKIKAEAEADYIRKLSSALSPEMVKEMLITEKVLDGYKAICASPASKVYLPADVQTIIDSVGSRGN